MKRIIKFSALSVLIVIAIFASCKKEKSCEGCATDSTGNTNKPPISIAGPDRIITLPTDSVSLNGSNSSDPDGMISEWLWTKISGPASSAIRNSSNAITIAKNLVTGVYQFELKVTDNSGLNSKDTVLITVNAAPVQPPDVTAGGDIIITLPLDSVYLGAGSTSITPVVFQWTKISGPFGVIITPSTTFTGTVLVKGLTPGLYSFRVEVSNAAGTSADTTNVLVINDLQDPNTITFKNLKWRLADEYGTGIIDLDIITPVQPNLFISWDQLRPVEIYLQLDSLSQWFSVSSIQSGIMYNYDAASPTIWVARIPRDDSWVGKESSIRIKLL